MSDRNAVHRGLASAAATLLVCAALAACSADAAIEGSFELQSPAREYPSAGCVYTPAGESAAIMLVDSSGDERHPAGTAHVRIDGVEHALQWIRDESSETLRYQNAVVELEASDFRSTGPECSGECEGSFHDAVLRIDYGGRSRRLDVSAHCGA